MSTYLNGVFDCMFLPCHVRIPEWIHTLYFPEFQGTTCSKEAQYLKFKLLQRDSNPQPLSSQTNTQPFGQTIELFLSTFVYGAFDCMFFSCHVRISNWIHIKVSIHIKCGFTLKWVPDMTKTHSQMHHRDKYFQNSSIIWQVWPNGKVFVYKLTGVGFESHLSHLNFRYRACFQQGVPWHSAKYRVWIHSNMRTPLNKNIQSNALYR